MSFADYLMCFPSSLSLQPNVVALIIVVRDIELGPNLSLVLFKNGYCLVKSVDQYILLLKDIPKSNYFSQHKLTTTESWPSSSEIILTVQIPISSGSERMTFIPQVLPSNSV